MKLRDGNQLSYCLELHVESNCIGVPARKPTLQVFYVLGGVFSYFHVWMHRAMENHTY